MACVMPVNSSYSVTSWLKGTLTLTLGAFVGTGAEADSLVQPRVAMDPADNSSSQKIRRMAGPPFITILTGQCFYHRNGHACQEATEGKTGTGRRGSGEVQQLAVVLVVTEATKFAGERLAGGGPDYLRALVFCRIPVN